MVEAFYALAPRQGASAPLPGSRGGPRQPEPVGERPQGVQADVGHDPFTARFNDHGDSAGSVHLGSALLVWVDDASTTSESLVRRALSRMVDAQLMRLGE